MEPTAVPGGESVLAGHAYIGAPMCARGKILGVLSVIGPAGREFSAEEAALLASIAEQVGVAVENAQLYEQAEALAVAEERQRLAREIHDTLAQGFTGIKLQLEAVESALEREEAGLALARLSSARRLANQSLAEARRSVWALRSTSLEKKRLEDALRDSVRGLTDGTGLAVTIEVEDPLPRFPTELERDLLRVAQEAVMNVVKHAQARNLAIEIGYEEKQIVLRVEDDGRGFATDAVEGSRADGSGFGLTAIRERVARHGGRLEIDSHHGRGTRITVCIESDGTGA
jgi:signal transduction histidine kinase